MFDFILVFGLAGLFPLALAIGLILFRLCLWPVYRLTGGRLSFLRWWSAMGPL